MDQAPTDTLSFSESVLVEMLLVSPQYIGTTWPGFNETAETLAVAVAVFTILSPPGFLIEGWAGAHWSPPRVSPTVHM